MAKRIFLGIFLIYLFGYIVHAAYLKQTVYGDGIFYYSWLRSVVVDRDWNFTNDYAYFHTNQPQSPLGIPGNKYSVGPALFWSPWFIWTHAVARGSGYEFPYQIAIGLSSVFYAYVGLLLLYRLLTKFFKNHVSIASTLAIACATNLLFYGSIDTVNSHAISFFVSILFLTFLFQKSKNWLLIGITLGFVALVRTQDVVYGVLLIPYLLKPRKIALIFCGLLLAFLPQLIAWQLAYGKFWVSPYISTTEGFRLQEPHILGVLFHPQNGLFLWTPMVLLGFIGLFVKNNQLPQKMLIAVILLELYLVASWSTWWQGASYSGRMFVSILPLIAFGIANVFTALRRFRFDYRHFLYIFVFPLSAINVCLITYFLLRSGTFSPSPYCIKHRYHYFYCLPLLSFYLLKRDFVIHPG